MVMKFLRMTQPPLALEMVHRLRGLAREELAPVLLMTMGCVGGSLFGVRGFTSDERDERMESLINQSLVPGASESAMSSAGRVVTSRREALSLYRDILRATRMFTWPNEQGEMWRDILRGSARKEFEAARFESDPEVVARLLVGGRDAVGQVLERFMAKGMELTRHPASPPS